MASRQAYSPQFREGHLTEHRRASTAGLLVQPNHGVVMDHHLSIGQPVDIEFDAVGLLSQSAGEGGEGVFEALPRGAAVRNDLWSLHVCSSGEVVVSRTPGTLVDTPAPRSGVSVAVPWGLRLTIASVRRRTYRGV
jgi:hypothetical protein